MILFGNLYFEVSKKINVGKEKPGSYGKILAKNIYDIFLKFETLLQKIMQVTNDEAHFINENLSIKIEKE